MGYPLVLKRKASRASGLLPLSVASGELGQGGSAPAPGPGGQEPSSGDARYVLKEGRRIGQQFYLVEMATDGRTLTISAYDGDNQQAMQPWKSVGPAAVDVLALKRHEVYWGT